MEVCIECGKKVSELYDGLCKDCYIKSHRFVEIPRRTQITVCPKCGRVRHKNTWIEESLDNAVKRAIEEALRISPEFKESSISISCRARGKSIFLCNLSVTGKVNDVEITEEKAIEVLLKRELCRSCSRRAGRYFEAILQIRGDRRVPEDEEINEIVEEIKKSIENQKQQGKEIFITEILPTKGGVDVYLSDRGFAKKTVQIFHDKFGGTVKTTSKQSGMKEGRMQYRMTYLLRLPYYRKGDLVSKGEKLFFIKSTGRGKVQLVDLESWEKVVVDSRAMEELKTAGDSSLFKEAIVVSQSDEEVQILDPYTYITVDIKKPRPATLKKTIKIVKWKDRIYLLPYQDL